MKFNVVGWIVAKEVGGCGKIILKYIFKDDLNVHIRV